MDLYRAGEHNTLFAEVAARHPAKPSKPLTIPAGPAAGQRYTYGPVTQPGPGLALIKKGGKPMKCNHFHAVPQTPCLQGAVAGEVPPADVGKCLFEH